MLQLSLLGGGGPVQNTGETLPPVRSLIQWTILIRRPPPQDLVHVLTAVVECLNESHACRLHSLVVSGAFFLHTLWGAGLFERSSTHDTLLCCRPPPQDLAHVPQSAAVQLYVTHGWVLQYRQFSGYGGGHSLLRTTRFRFRRAQATTLLCLPEPHFAEHLLHGRIIHLYLQFNNLLVKKQFAGNYCEGHLRLQSLLGLYLKCVA